MRRPRHLSAEERALWDLIASRTKPLDVKGPRLAAPATKPDRKAPVVDDRPPRPEALRPFNMGEAADHSGSNDLIPGLGERMRQAPIHMDSKSYGRMKRGKLVPEGRIDLHGMTIGQAHPVLTSFILRAHAADKRLVLVITGKGKQRPDNGPIPTRHGILRHQVPQWLGLAPLNQVVLQVTPAHVKHGGEGAYYVYLRRRK